MATASSASEAVTKTASLRAAPYIAPRANAARGRAAAPALFSATTSFAPSLARPLAPSMVSPFTIDAGPSQSMRGSAKNNSLFIRLTLYHFFTTVLLKGGRTRLCTSRDHDQHSAAIALAGFSSPLTATFRPSTLTSLSLRRSDPCEENPNLCGDDEECQAVARDAVCVPIGGSLKLYL